MIIVDHVTKYYGAHAAVRDLDFTIEAGECVGFLGLNGAGKTTTLHLLSCLLLPTSGRVTIKGLDAETNPHEIRKLIGFLPDHPPVYPEMTVSSYLEFAGRIRKMTAAAVEKRLPEVVQTAGLDDVIDDPIQTLSHGYRQRVGIAQAIIHDPTLLILDEPIQGLDPVQIVEMREMIRRLRGKHTILLSSHILSEIEQTCDRILMLHEGHIAAEGTEAELASRFQADARTLDLVVRVPEGVSDGGSAALKDTEHVVDVESGPLSAERVCKLRIRTQGDAREAVARVLVQKGFGLLHLEEASSGLEEIFVQLSKGQARASNGARKAAAS